LASGFDLFNKFNFRIQAASNFSRQVLREGLAQRANFIQHHTECSLIELLTDRELENPIFSRDDGLCPEIQVHDLSFSQTYDKFSQCSTFVKWDETKVVLILGRQSA
jgi:hypothetical protein